LNIYTVMLLVPDFVAENFGHDTYMAHVQAEDVTDAIEEAIDKACEARRVPDTDNEGRRRESWHVLLVAAGHIHDISDQEDCETANIPMTRREREGLMRLLLNIHLETGSNITAAIAKSLLNKLRHAVAGV
jgi:hypothetical protein